MVEIIGGFTPSNMNSWSMKNIPRWKEKTSSTPPQWLWGYMFMFGNRICTLPETNSSPLKMDGSNTTFLLERPVFRFHAHFFRGVSKVFLEIAGLTIGCLHLGVQFEAWKFGGIQTYGPNDHVGWPTILEKNIPIPPPQQTNCKQHAIPERKSWK